MNYRFSMRDAMDLAAKKTGVAGWCAYQWEAVGDDNIVRGCVPLGTYTRGPRKGHPKFKPAMPGSERTIVVAKIELERHAAEYEETEGKCWDCKGEGKELAGWSVEEGNKYRTCTRCKGNGLPPNLDLDTTLGA
jgi:hypothetical protein